MKSRQSLTALCVAAMLAPAACGSDEGGGSTGASGGGTPQGPTIAVADLTSAEDAQVGSVTMRDEGGKVQVEVEANGLTPGYHGFHVHEAGVCEKDAMKEGEPSPFATAMGHLGPGEETHGDHAGDFPPLLVAKDGSAAATFATDRLSVDVLLDQDGSAVIVHAEPDNQANIPDRYAAKGPDEDTLDTGDSGDRAACGALRAPS